MSFITGVNLLPATGEWAYDTIAHQGRRASEADFSFVNTYATADAGRTDYAVALDQLQAQFPDCTTIALIVAWFGNATDASLCQIYPSTTYIGGRFTQMIGGTSSGDDWRCSGLTQMSAGLIPISSHGTSFTYGGTPSDPSIVRCIRDLKARGLRVVFYPFILMDCAGFPWRGRIGYAPDGTSAATSAVTSFLGSAAVGEFSRDATNLTVAYAGAPTNYCFRRMILHYANLCAVAGGVDLFLIGSEFRGLETLRGPGWSKAGDVGGDGLVTWDYPFVQGLIQLSDDVRSIFDGAGLARDATNLKNLIAYSADWSDWMGFQHPGENGQWPHLDQLYGHANIDLVSFDNYMPMSDWTTGDGGLDGLHWAEPRPDPAAWPPAAAAMNGLGLTGQATLKSKDYLKANIEGGDKFAWFYDDGDNLGLGLDPRGSDLRVSCPAGDRASQARNPYYPGQQILANKQIRWWWNNPHQAVYDAGDGAGYAPHGPHTKWAVQSKSITFAEYGVPSVDRGTNQPNVFYDPKSTESFTPYWSVWEPADGGGYRPRRDDELQLLALQALHEYWVTDGNNETSGAGLRMLEPAFMSAWNWDARPFPVFPIRTDVWGDAGNWRAGNWLGGKGPFVTPPVPDAPPVAGPYPGFPTLAGQGWSVLFTPRFSTNAVQHVSGRESRANAMSSPLWSIDLTYDVLRFDDATRDVQTLVGFFEAQQGQALPFLFPVPPELGIGTSLVCRFDDDSQDLEEFMVRLVTLKSLKLTSVKG